MEELIEELKSTIEKTKETSKQLENKFKNSYKFVEVDTEVIEFCKNIVNTKSLMTVVIKDIINNNHLYKFTYLKSVSSFLESNLRKKYYLIDFATFNCVKFKDINNKYLFDISVESYKEDISLCENFEDAYILVDYAFMQNFSDIIKENILKNYAINIYMFEREYFMIHLKRDSRLIESEIKFYKNKCCNPMLEEKSENVNPKEVEEFTLNYYNLLIMRDFFQKDETEYKIDELYLFDYKSRINYTMGLCKKPDDNKIKLNSNKENKSKKSDWNIQILSVKNEFNKYYDYLEDEFIQSFDYKNLIFIRKTEFGIRFEQKRMESIIKYLFHINEDINIIDKLLTVNKLNIVSTEIKYGNDTLFKFLNNNNTLPFLVQPNNKINPKLIPLIEYEYFLSMPLLLPKKEVNKPDILILSNDFGLLNYYYNNLYKNILNIDSFTESKYINGKPDIFKINYDNIKIKDFFEVVEDRKKVKNSNIDNYDLIILESFDKRDENDITIPNYDLLTIFSNILNCNGIFAFNLRYETFNDNTIIIEKLKKKYKKVIEIKLRIGSGFIICCGSEKIEMVKYYKPQDNIVDNQILNEIEQKLKEI